jgi:hypothetical protein
MAGSPGVVVRRGAGDRLVGTPPTGRPTSVARVDTGPFELGPGSTADATIARRVGS